MGRAEEVTDRPKKQTQAATQAMVTELPAEEKEGKENGPQPWTGRKLWPQEETGM